MKIYCNRQKASAKELFKKVMGKDIWVCVYKRAGMHIPHWILVASCSDGSFLGYDLSEMMVEYYNRDKYDMGDLMEYFSYISPKDYDPYRSVEMLTTSELFDNWKE